MSDPAGFSLDMAVNYFEAYNILMEYWDCIPDEEKAIVHERLEKLNLCAKNAPTTHGNYQIMI